MKKYSGTADFFRVDVDKFYDYRFCIDNNGWGIADSSSCITDKSIYSIYYRKPMLPDLSVYEHQYHSMIQKDIIAVINGITDAFQGTVLTKPSILRKVENKVYQLMYASKSSIDVPKSYIGNNKDECTDYGVKTSIIKPLTTGKTYGVNGWEIYQTNIFRGIEDDIRLTPVYLQDYIAKQYEVRLTIVGKNAYCVRIDTLNQIDWRADYPNHRYKVVTCPTEILDKCFTMLDAFELSFGAFDFIVTPDNKWIFLEVNPNGQWLWLEQSLKLDISQKIINFLCK